MRGLSICFVFGFLMVGVFMSAMERDIDRLTHRVKNLEFQLQQQSNKTVEIQLEKYFDNEDLEYKYNVVKIVEENDDER